MKDWSIVWSNVIFIICVILWPKLVIKLVNKNITSKKFSNMNSFRKQFGEVLFEKEWWGVVVLEFDDILNHVMDCLNLIVLQSSVNGWSIEKLVRIVLLGYLVSVEHWKFFSKVLFVMLSYDAMHWLTIKWKDCCHVWSIQLKERFKENSRCRLLLHQIKDLWLSWTLFNTLEK